MADDGVFHDEIEIEDFEYDDENETFTYPCPCGDLFTVSKEELLNGEEIARCPSCSLVIRVIYNADELQKVIEVKTKQTTPSLVVN
ncbi:CSL zinc finger containing protein-like protein [Leptotrombidium deliense]|uniref:Diphthamide biosynthesis protein 3 n=1 Tax=Leptotrombidium deliense TaxID=299467 RepID=A0A443SKL1_9ACAR|nr:CSL zinc finger containing protein-like protein [Leptotrombidium deliense]